MKDAAKQKSSIVSYLRYRTQAMLAPGGKLDNVFTLCLILNVVQMALYFDEGSKQYTRVLDIINIVFTGVYTVEAALKIWSYGCQRGVPRYFSSNWNRFDFAIVTISLGEIIFSSLITSSTRAFKSVPQIIRLLRVIRITRILRLIGKYEGL